MSNWIIKQNGVVVNKVVGEESFIKSVFPTPEYEVEELTTDNDFNTDVPASTEIDWQLIQDELRATSIWNKVFILACSDLTANALFTLLYGSLISSHNVADLTYAIKSIRIMMRAIGNDLTPQELDKLRTSFSANNLDPAILDLD